MAYNPQQALKIGTEVPQAARPRPTPSRPASHASYERPLTGKAAPPTSVEFHDALECANRGCKECRAFLHGLKRGAAGGRVQARQAIAEEQRAARRRQQSRPRR